MPTRETDSQTACWRRLVAVGDQLAAMLTKRALVPAVIDHLSNRILRHPKAGRDPSLDLRLVCSGACGPVSERRITILRVTVGSCPIDKTASADFSGTVSARSCRRVAFSKRLHRGLDARRIRWTAKRRPARATGRAGGAVAVLSAQAWIAEGGILGAPHDLFDDRHNRSVCRRHGRLILSRNALGHKYEAGKQTKHAKHLNSPVLNPEGNQDRSLGGVNRRSVVGNKTR
jgi:hypothetical protein